MQRLNPCRNRLVRAASVLLVAVSIWTYLVLSLPRYASVPCPDVTAGPAGGRRVSARCGRILAGDTTDIALVTGYQWCQRHDAISDEAYIALAANCTAFRATRRYAGAQDSEAEERAFPLAFSILLHESVEQAERLLRAVYRPHNFYCVHVDAKAAPSVQRAVRAIGRCLPNVIVPPSIKVHWSQLSVLQAELLCMRQLLTRPGWRYFINLTGREFPLKTNAQLVRILRAYGGANDIDGSPHKRPLIWTKYVWRSESWRTGVEKAPPPDRFLISKGSTHIAATRRFVSFALTSEKAGRLYEWMTDIRVPDEHFFQTLNHNPQLGVPGAYRGDPDLKWSYTRLKVWQSAQETCTGRWYRFICQLGSGDLWRLPKATQLFVNKLHLEMDPVAFECAEQWHANQTRAHAQIDLKFYRNLDFVKNHAP